MFGPDVLMNVPRLSGWCRAAGRLPVPEGRLPHGLQETVGGDRWSQASLRPGQLGVRRGAAALGRSSVSNHRRTFTMF